ERQIVRQLLLHREVPVLHVGVAIVGGNVAHLRGQGIEGRRAGEVVGVAQLRGTEAGDWRGVGGAQRLSRQLVDGRVHDVGSVITQKIFTAQPVEVNIADPEGAANHRAVQSAPGKTYARREIIVPRMHQRAIVQATGLPRQL